MSNIELIEITGKEKGPNVAIIAGVHGNEICGVKAIKKIIPNFKIKKGKIIFIIANKLAIKNKVRFVESDLNRSFSTLKTKTLEQKTAKEIKKILLKVDFMLDIHASTSEESKPFCICEKHSLDIVKYLPVKKVLINLDKFHSGSTDEFMNKQNKVGICIECGWLGSKKSINTAIRAIKIFCASLGLINYKIKNKNQEILKATRIYKNKKSAFTPIRKFKDFEKINNNIIGYEGKTAIFGKNNELILFAKKNKKTNKECFLIAKKLF